MTETFTPKQYAEHLAEAGKRMSPEVTKTVNRAVIQIRDSWFKASLRSNRKMARAYPYTIRARYAKVIDGTITASVQPVGSGRSQAKLGAILEHGGPRNAPQLNNRRAAEAEAPNLAKWLAKLAADSCR